MAIHPDRDGIYDYPFMKLETEESTYVVGGVIPYPGSDAVGAPVKIWVVCGKQGSTTTFSVRVFDKTNALAIAGRWNKSDDYPTLLELDTVQNVSEGPAIWEIQIKKTAGVEGKAVYVASAVMEY